ncbi:septal ring lytic transglycosylase RlpA family protein [Lichenibacterium minor]|uniref:septal ring lytic transglycosylase RlpA family protein n=1 Tax=Lichenibacterium minor TaxID=2316528 RepID=UPI002682FBAA
MKFKVLAVSALVLSGSFVASAAEAHTHRSARGGGLASWYGPGFGGHRTASGERFNAGAFTAAHRFLPFGSQVRVTSRRTGRSIVVRINDRGPFAAGRIIDLTPAASRALGMQGTEPVTLARL